MLRWSGIDKQKLTMIQLTGSSTLKDTGRFKRLW